MTLIPLNVYSTDSNDWTPTKDIAKGIKAITKVAETAIALTDSFGSYSITFTVKLPASTTLFGFDHIAISYQNYSGSDPDYKKTLKIWTSKDDAVSYQKGLEFSFKDSTKGEVYYCPGPFIKATSPAWAWKDSKFKLVYTTSGTDKIMTFNSDNGAGVLGVMKTCARLTKAATYYDVYVTSHLNFDSGAGAPNNPAINDAYLFGARISTTNTAHYYTTAKQGVSDTKIAGLSYDFSAYGFNVAGFFPFNCARFDKADDNGFVGDGWDGTNPVDSNYPDPSVINAANLPTVNDVENADFTALNEVVF